MELRKDYILDRYVIISEGRGKRPKQFKKEEVVKDEGTCFFCPGNENLTPPEIGRIEKNGKWKLRWFANKFAALSPEGNPVLKRDNTFYEHASAYGYHEVVVETDDHKRQLAELSEEELEAVLNVYSMRIKELEKKPNMQYVNVIKNNGLLGGTSIIHTHSQIFATAIIPPVILDEVMACRRFIYCPYCKIVEKEKNSDRRCFENEDWVAFAPYASRYNYEISIFPKAHIKRLEESNLKSLSFVLKKVLGKINELNCSYNYEIHYSPKGYDLHMHIEVYPQIAIFGGFERGSGIIINSVSPEDAAKFYRGEL